jgi:methylmalonyl-CoA/ethylmalonyl-CoA epimerase
VNGRIDHVGVVVDDLAGARRLLEEIVGMQLLVARSLPAARVETAFLGYGPGALVELVELGGEEERRRRLGDGVQSRVEHIAIEVDDVEAARDELRARGIEMQSDTPSINGPTRSFFTRPETSRGIVLQFMDRRAE